ncbi:MAG TPA: EAL domain-containing protein [Acidimicrobiales bacterium]|nr:EAL domain-containing protein [Acidimicrobiales bacterium]
MLGEAAATGLDSDVPPPLRARLRLAVRDPGIWVNPPVAAAFCLMRWQHLIALLPYWVYVVFVAGGGTASVLIRAVLGDGRRQWHIVAYVGVTMTVIAVVAYSTGWGPILSIGFLFGTGAALDLYGSRATKWALLFTTVCMGVAELGIAVGAVPTLIHRPLIHGLAGLSLLGALATISLLGRVTVAREKVANDLRQSERRFKALVSNAADIIIVTDFEGRLQYASPAFERQLGLPAEPFYGQVMGGFIHEDDLQRLSEEFPPLVADPSRVLRSEMRIADAEGVWRQFETVITNRVDDPDVRGIVANLHDVTEQRRMQEHLAHAAIHDPLTGLPNRVLFMDRLSMALRRAERGRRVVAVAFLDLDRFKLINDGLGHAVGDELLQSVAARLLETLRSVDTVARFGGDEFTILWDDVRDQDEVTTIVRRLLADLQRPFPLDHGPVFVTASIGVALSVESGATPSSMLRDADTAMYLAKESGRNQMEVFESNSHAVALKSFHLLNELHGALTENEFRLCYQPIIELDSGAVVATEALIRWEHPTRGLLGPDQFVPMAEETGLIVPVGGWALRTACQQAAAWNRRAAELGRQHLDVHVNVSPRQLGSSGCIESVARAVDEAGITPGMLCLEITEGTLMRNERAAAETLQALHRLGVKISVDDFGTGYSSLSYLKHFPIDSLKVDRTFVDGLGEDPEDSAIVSAVVALAHSLGLTAVAEGVETDIALEELRLLGCDLGQGYLFGAPVPPDELDDMLFEPSHGLAPVAT